MLPQQIEEWVNDEGPTLPSDILMDARKFAISHAFIGIEPPLQLTHDTEQLIAVRLKGAALIADFLING